MKKKIKLNSVQKKKKKKVILNYLVHWANFGILYQEK